MVMDKYVGSMLLSAAGDALGWLTEFLYSPQELQSRYGTDLVTQFLLGESDLEPGAYTDDTQLSLCAARSILPDGSCDNEYFAKVELPNFLLYHKGGSITCINASHNVKRPEVHWNTNFFGTGSKTGMGGYQKAGANGAAMRVLPIALANAGNTERLCRELFLHSIVTHGHPRAIAASLLYGYAVHLLLSMKESDFSPIRFLHQLSWEFPETVNLSRYTDETVMEWMERWNTKSAVNGSRVSRSFESVYEDTLVEVTLLIKDISDAFKFSIDAENVMQRWGCFGEQRGSGTLTVAAALLLLCVNVGMPQQGIIRAVNFLNTDTDTIACILGGMAGALYGAGAIPNEWRTVQDAEYIRSHAERLFSVNRGAEIEPLPRFDTPPAYVLLLELVTESDIRMGQRIWFKPFGSGTISVIGDSVRMRDIQFKVQFDIGQSIEFRSSCLGKR